MSILMHRLEYEVAAREWVGEENGGKWMLALERK